LAKGKKVVTSSTAKFVGCREVKKGVSWKKSALFPFPSFRGVLKGARRAGVALSKQNLDGKARGKHRL